MKNNIRKDKKEMIEKKLKKTKKKTNNIATTTTYIKKEEILSYIRTRKNLWVIEKLSKKDTNKS